MDRKIILILAAIFIPSLVAVSTGFEKCKIPDLEIFLPSMSPCFKCVCVNQGARERCSIEKETCSILSCSLQETHRNKCCKQCKSCVVDGHVYKNREKWKDPEDNCTVYQCNEGIVSSVSPKCVTTCKNQMKLAGECCPRCRGCTYNGLNITEGNSIDVGVCTTCKCKNGSLLCERKVCPLLHCLNPSIVNGECCPSCRQDSKPTYININEQKCFIKGTELDNGRNYKVDKCATCKCQNGTVSCIRQQCKEDSSCTKQSLIYTEKHCCPICSSKITCTYMGKIYHNKERWFLPRCAVCKCVNGHNECRKQKCMKDINCSQGYSAGYVPGSCCLSCLPIKKTCIGFGDPHYRTFDGKSFSYQGVCKYTFTKDCSKDKSYTISVRNNGRYTNHFSWIKTVTFSYANITITLQQKHRVKVNGNDIKVPFLYYPYIDIRKSKRYLHLYTKDGITIKWDGDSYLQVALPKKYMNKVCGLCGNFNSDPSDDFKLPNGIMVPTVKLFGDYWRQKTSRACKKKRHVKFNNRPQLVNCIGWKLFHAHKICRKVFSDVSIYKCKWNIHVGNYFQDCVTDVCHCPYGKQHCECGAIRSYYERCSNVVKNLKWKQKEKCDVSCTGGSVYSLCGPGCQQTCKTINTLEPCNKKCVPGCHCPAGFVWHKERCIVQYKCP